MWLLIHAGIKINTWNSDSLKATTGNWLQFHWQTFSVNFYIIYKSRLAVVSTHGISLLNSNQIWWRCLCVMLLQRTDVSDLTNHPKSISSMVWGHGPWPATFLLEHQVSLTLYILNYTNMNAFCMVIQIWMHFVQFFITEMVERVEILPHESW